MSGMNVKFHSKNLILTFLAKEIEGQSQKTAFAG